MRLPTHVGDGSCADGDVIGWREQRAVHRNLHLFHVRRRAGIGRKVEGDVVDMVQQSAYSLFDPSIVVVAIEVKAPDTLGMLPQRANIVNRVTSNRQPGISVEGASSKRKSPVKRGPFSKLPFTNCSTSSGSDWAGSEWAVLAEEVGLAERKPCHTSNKQKRSKHEATDE